MTTKEINEVFATDVNKITLDWYRAKGGNRPKFIELVNQALLDYQERNENAEGDVKFNLELERRALNGKYHNGKKVMKWFKDYCNGKRVGFSG